MDQLKQVEISDQITQAELMTSWLVDKVYANEGTETPLVSKPAPIVVARLTQLFGGGESVHEHLDKLKLLFNELPSEHHGNALLFCSGYPTKVIDILADGAVDETLEILHEIARPFRAEPTTRVTEVLETPLMTVEQRQRLAGKAPIALRATGMFRPLNDEDETWREDALCAQTDPEAFFPEKGGSTRDAKKICADCDVKEQCLEYALGIDERYGIWGGLSERERRKFKKKSKYE